MPVRAYLAALRANRINGSRMRGSESLFHSTTNNQPLYGNKLYPKIKCLLGAGTPRLLFTDSSNTLEQWKGVGLALGLALAP